jgi:hypothetical protein
VRAPALSFTADRSGALSNLNLSGPRGSLQRALRLTPSKACLLRYCGRGQGWCRTAGFDPNRRLADPKSRTAGKPQTDPLQSAMVSPSLN